MSGSFGAPDNSAGILVTAEGGGVEVRFSDISTNPGYGLAVQDPGFYVHGNVFNTNRIGIGAFIDGGSQLTGADSIFANAISGSLYAVALTPASLQAFYDTVLPPNNTDTLRLMGGRLTASARLPRVPGFVWNVVDPVFIDSGATLTIAAGDTVAFDDSTLIQVGVPGSGEGALSAVSTPAEPILLTASRSNWWGIHFADIAYIEGSPTQFDYVVVEKAGHIEPCFGLLK